MYLSTIRNGYHGATYTSTYTLVIQLLLCPYREGTDMPSLEELSKTFYIPEEL